jgi:CheY-like chemotaxis protein
MAQTYTRRVKPLVLVADDDAAMRLLAHATLEQGGFSVELAEDGTQALAAFEKLTPDVVLLDVMMPGMDGLEVCARMRGDEKMREIPVILLTAKDDMETRAQGMALGVSEYLTKPINKRELFTRIEAQLHAREIDRKLSETVAAVTDPKNKLH